MSLWPSVVFLHCGNHRGPFTFSRCDIIFLEVRIAERLRLFRRAFRKIPCRNYAGHAWRERTKLITFIKNIRELVSAAGGLRCPELDTIPRVIKGWWYRWPRIRDGLASRLVNVNWNANDVNDGWNVYANPFTNANEWNAGNQVFSRNRRMFLPLSCGRFVFKASCPSAEHFADSVEMFRERNILFIVNRLYFPENLQKEFCEIES